jgi:hypothetical protein
VDAELRADGGGGPLMVEALANILAVHLIRHTTGARRLLGSKPVLLPLQTDRRRHAGTVLYLQKMSTMFPAIITWNNISTIISKRPASPDVAQAGKEIVLGCQIYRISRGIGHSDSKNGS